MAGRRLREAVKQTLISNGNGEFDEETQIVIAGLSNTYSQYVATFEEYKQQRYEVGGIYRKIITKNSSNFISIKNCSIVSNVRAVNKILAKNFSDII